MLPILKYILCIICNGHNTVKTNRGIDILRLYTDYIKQWQGKLTLPCSESPLVVMCISVVLWIHLVVL